MKIINDKSLESVSKSHPNDDCSEKIQHKVRSIKRQV